MIDKLIDTVLILGWLYIIFLMLSGCSFTEMYDGSAAHWGEMVYDNVLVSNPPKEEG